MFTGIIETTGIVRNLRTTARGARLALDASDLVEAPAPGASIALNGVCQTVANNAFPLLEFDVIPETLRRSTLGTLRPGDRVNLEASLRPGDRLDGHFVQGHVDATATITAIDTSGGEWRLHATLDDETHARYLIPKGSIAIDGVSLTIADVEDAEAGAFHVALIPATLDRTNLADRRVGDRVNVETDILARTVIHFLERMRPEAPPTAALTYEFLQQHGFA
jgi:riboflavin synthase